MQWDKQKWNQNENRGKTEYEEERKWKMEKQRKWTCRQRNKENKLVWDKNEIKIEAFGVKNDGSFSVFFHLLCIQYRFIKNNQHIVR